MTASNLITVTAAVIRRNGRILICRRRIGKKHAGQWEFPGGKLKHGETPPAALRREIHEELKVNAVIGSEIYSYEYTYSNSQPMRLIFFEVTKYFGSLNYAHFQEARWATPEDLPSFDFLDGDVEFVKKLATGELG